MLPLAPRLVLGLQQLPRLVPQMLLPMRRGVEVGGVAVLVLPLVRLQERRWLARLVPPVGRQGSSGPPVGVMGLRAHQRRRERPLPPRPVPVASVASVLLDLPVPPAVPLVVLPALLAAGRPVSLALTARGVVAR